MKSPCCLCVCLYVYLSLKLSKAWIVPYEICYVYHGTRAHLNSVLHKSLPSAIPNIPAFQIVAIIILLLL
jgi:hypothetical protein